LAKRRERREEAQKGLTEAEEAGDAESMEKFSRRLVKVTPEHNAECKRLLKLMGIPYIDAPCEAEAQCAALVKAGKVYATGTEDMDALTFGSTVLLRHLTFSEARKTPIREFYLERILAELELSQDEFIDLCILLGCDYCDSIKGIGPKRAIDLIKQYKTIEEIIKHLDTKKYTLPEEWPYQEARELFKNPEVVKVEDVELKWEGPNEEELIKFMVEEKGFSEDRIRSGIKKLTKARQGSTQGRLDSFFKVLPSPSSSSKRKSEDSKGPKAKKTKPATGGKFKKPK